MKTVKFNAVRMHMHSLRHYGICKEIKLSVRWTAATYTRFFVIIFHVARCMYACVYAHKVITTV